jgi:small subunit ribosomal protein S6
LNTVAKRLYEGLFLIDSGEAASDWDGIIEMIRRLLEKGQAEVVSIRKWDDRRLAYNISGKDRGTYILAYFNAPTSAISGIERDIRLSERIMRAMILRGDEITKEDMEKETPAMRPQVMPETTAAAPAETVAVESPVEEAADIEGKDSQN